MIALVAYELEFVNRSFLGWVLRETKFFMFFFTMIVPCVNKLLRLPTVKLP